MPAYLGVLSIALVIGAVLVRVQILRSRGVSAMKFGAIDKSDYLIPPIAAFYLYVICANAFGWPSPVHRQTDIPAIEWAGVLFCAIGVLLMYTTLVSFGTSFRVGIDAERPDKLVTTGVFAFTRNPIYVAFAFVLVGEMLIFQNGITVGFVGGGFVLFHRQVLLEEAFLREHYGAEYAAYCKRVRRYL